MNILSAKDKDNIEKRFYDFDDETLEETADIISKELGLPKDDVFAFLLELG